MYRERMEHQILTQFIKELPDRVSKARQTGQTPCTTPSTVTDVEDEAAVEENSLSTELERGYLSMIPLALNHRSWGSSLVARSREISDSKLTADSPLVYVHKNCTRASERYVIFPIKEEIDTTVCLHRIGEGETTTDPTEITKKYSRIYDTRRQLKNDLHRKKIGGKYEKLLHFKTPKGTDKYSILHVTQTSGDFKSTRTSHLFPNLPQIYDKFNDEKTSVIILDQQHDHIISQLPDIRRQILIIFKSIINDILSVLEDTDVDQVSLSIFIQNIDKEGDGTTVDTLLDQLTEATRSGQLPHYLYDCYNVLGRETRQTLDSIYNKLTHIDYDVMTVDDVIQTPTNVKQLQDVAFEIYGKSCKYDILPRHHVINEIYYLKQEFPGLIILDEDENYHTLQASKAMFHLVVKMVESDEMKTLEALCIERITQRENFTCLSANEERTVMEKKLRTSLKVHESVETEDVPKSQLELESRLAIAEIARIFNELEEARNQFKMIAKLVLTMPIPDSITSKILLEEGKFQLTDGKRLAGEETLLKSLELDPKNQDSMLYLHLSDSTYTEKYLLQWLHDEDITCPKRIYLFFFSEADLELTEQFEELHTEIRFVMGLEDSNNKYLKESADADYRMIVRIPIPARVVLCYLIMKTGTCTDQIQDKCLKIMISTAAKSSKNTKYQCWSLLGHVQKPREALTSFHKAREAFDTKTSYLIKMKTDAFQKRQKLKSTEE